MVGYVHKCSKHLKAALGNGLQKNNGTGLVYKTIFFFLVAYNLVIENCSLFIKINKQTNSKA